MLSRRKIMLKLAFGRLLKPSIHRAKTTLFASRKRTADAIRKGRRQAQEQARAAAAGQKPKELSGAEAWMASRKGQKQMLRDERSRLNRKARSFEPKPAKAKPDSKLQESMNAIAGKKPKSAPPPKAPSSQPPAGQVPLDKSRTNLEKIEGFKARSKARRAGPPVAPKPDNRRFSGSRRSSLPGGSKRPQATPPSQPAPTPTPQPAPAAQKPPSQPSGGAQKPPPNKKSTGKPKEEGGITGRQAAVGAGLLATGGLAGATLAGRSKEGSVKSIMMLSFANFISN